jgi:hypothetical protein
MEKAAFVLSAEHRMRNINLLYRNSIALTKADTSCKLQSCSKRSSSTKDHMIGVGYMGLNGKFLRFRRDGVSNQEDFTRQELKSL